MEIEENRRSLTPSEIREPRVPRAPHTARSPRKSYAYQEKPKKMRVDSLRDSTRKGFDTIHARNAYKKFSFLDKEYQVSQRIEEFTFNKEVLSRQKSPPKRIHDDHVCEKVVSTRRLLLSTEGRSESLPILERTLSPRSPLPKEKKTYPKRSHVYFWG